MNAKEYLQQISDIDEDIANKVAERDNWKKILHGNATNTTAAIGGERVQSSGSKQKLADAVDKYVDIERRINDRIDELIAKKQEIVDTIDGLPFKYRDLLHKLYVQGYELQEVADMKRKSYSNITTLHGHAISALQKLLDAYGN